MVATIAAVQPGSRPGKRIVLTTVGSLGDLHPYIAIALGLKANGHDAVVAASQYYRAKIERLGLGFRAVRPDAEWMTDPGVIRRIMDLRRGTERVLRELVLPALRDSYEDTLLAADGARLLVSHPLTYATRLVAEKTGIPWVSSMPAPVGLFSAYAPPLVPGYPVLSRRLRFLGRRFWKLLSEFLKRRFRFWAEPLDRFRAEIGLPASADNPLVDWHSPWLVLALFSPLLAGKQPDWPSQTVITGFPFFDGHGEAALTPELSAFLEGGPPPIVFTLGSAAVLDAGRFFQHGADAAKRLGRRAVLVVGRHPGDRRSDWPEGVHACDYAPFSRLFPRAALIVHHGGIGTTGQAMRSGRPMLVVPCAHDQPDNADRVVRLGIARTIPRRRYTPARVAAALGELLADPECRRRALEIGCRVGREDGVRAACDALEGLL
jgi:UDP:flavonoid glycosyltransferase YjiC (YdhE family)